MPEIGAPHKLTHQDGGNDEISVEGLSGALADNQPSTWSLVSSKPSTFTPSAHKTSHQDAGSDKIDCAGLDGRVNLVNRGDPSAWDFTVANFTTDGAWHELDLSSIIPAGTKAVLLKIHIFDDTTDIGIHFARAGDTNLYNRSSVYIQVAAINMTADIIVFVSSDRKIQYMADNTTWSYIYLLVRGWFI